MNNHPVPHTLPLLGTRVRYVRNHHDKGILKGEGTIKAFGFDPNNRIIALVQDAENPTEQFHVFEQCIDATPEFEAYYADTVGKVQVIAEDANTRIRAITDEANAAIQELEDTIGKRFNLGGEAVASLSQGTLDDAEAV